MRCGRGARMWCVDVVLGHGAQPQCLNMGAGALCPFVRDPPSQFFGGGCPSPRVSLCVPPCNGTGKCGLRLLTLFLRRGTWRSFTSQTDGEARVTRVLREKFPRASAIKVVDISGGCGAMYEIHIESEDFREKRTVQQHQMVNQALSEEIKSMHGLRIFTSTPKAGC
ncbi:bolA-like protein 3 [Gymnogyps californianus]|nr:bolA-like protein 3 [Gymnogyps californianus]